MAVVLYTRFPLVKSPNTHALDSARWSAAYTECASGAPKSLKQTRTAYGKNDLKPVRDTVRTLVALGATWRSSAIYQTPVTPSSLQRGEDNSQLYAKQNARVSALWVLKNIFKMCIRCLMRCGTSLRSENSSFASFFSDCNLTLQMEPLWNPFGFI